MAKGIDCAIPLTAEKAQAIHAAGYEFVCRYLVPERYAWKRLTRSEAEAITAAGMKIVSVFETTANRPAGGAAAGEVDGVEAYREAKAIGQPEGTAIYFAVDYDAQPKDYDAIEAYLRGAGKKIPGYCVGVYGSYFVVEEMVRRGAAKHFWQTYAWSRGRKSPHANIWQYKNSVTLAGHTVDLNESYGGEGWWDTRGKGVEKSMTQEEKQAFDALVARVAALEALVKKIPAPAWFVKEFGSADIDGLILEPQFTEEGWRTLAVALRAQGKGIGAMR